MDPEIGEIWKKYQALRDTTISVRKDLYRQKISDNIGNGEGQCDEEMVLFLKTIEVDQDTINKVRSEKWC